MRENQSKTELASIIRKIEKVDAFSTLSIDEMSVLLRNSPLTDELKNALETKKFGGYVASTYGFDAPKYIDRSWPPRPRRVRQNKEDVIAFVCNHDPELHGFSFAHVEVAARIHVIDRYERVRPWEGAEEVELPVCREALTSPVVKLHRIRREDGLRLLYVLETQNSCYVMQEPLPALAEGGKDYHKLVWELERRNPGLYTEMFRLGRVPPEYLCKSE